VFLKDPYPHLIGEYDLWVMNDLAWYERDPTVEATPAIRDGKRNYCTCFMYIIPSDRTKRLLHELIETMERHSKEKPGGCLSKRSGMK